MPPTDAYELSSVALLCGAVFLWLGEFVWFRSPRDGGSNTRDVTFLLNVAGIVGSIVLTVVLRTLDVAVPSEHELLLVVRCGAIVAAAGAFLRYWAHGVLGRWFSRRIAVRPDQELVTGGPYRRLRHPLYLGLILLTAGTCLFIGSWLGALVSVVIMLVTLHLRILEEEREMERVLGDRYRQWRDQRKRLIPWIY